MDDADPKRPAQYRLAWRWKVSGVTGAGPWMHRSEVVEGWLDSLSRRHGDSVLHRIEVAELPPDRLHRNGRR